MQFRLIGRLPVLGISSLSIGRFSKSFSYLTAGGKSARSKSKFEYSIMGILEFYEPLKNNTKIRVLDLHLTARQLIFSKTPEVIPW